MKSQEICPDVEELLKWRRQLYNALGSRRETVMELLDSLSSNRQASTVAELSLNPLFRRDYNSLYRGIQEFLPSPTNDNYQKAVDSLLSVVSATIPPPVSRQFYLFGVNVPWAIPLSGQRVSSGEKDISVASNQVKKILNHSSVPWKDKLSVLVADSLYSQRGFLGEQVKQNNLVTLTRVRSNRVFYRQFIPEDYSPKQPGHPRWYGDKFDLKDQTTWLEPDEIIQSTFTTKRGRELNLKISGWKQMLMRGTSDYEMHSHPFTLLQIIVSDETGKAVWKPMWLILIGSRRYELSLQECYEAYGQRYDLEHLFRFGKQKLLLNAYYTPEVNHEENWVQLTLLAAVNLWATRKLALVLLRPWEQYLKKSESVEITPSLVQRDFYRIISEIGTLVKSPKRRGYSAGRIKGYKKVPRTRHQVIKKQTKSKKEKMKVP